MVHMEISMLDDETLMFDVKVPKFDLRSLLSDVKKILSEIVFSDICRNLWFHEIIFIMSDVEILMIMPF